MSDSNAPKGLAKPVKLSSDLEAIVGAGPKPRTLVTKELWFYIKANDLQDPNNKRMINPDEKLAKVLGTEPINMMQIAKALSKHIIK